MALSLSRPKHRSVTTPSLIHLFSSSSSPNDHLAPENPTNSQSDPTQPQQQQPSFSSYFSDVKASLRHQQQQHPQAQNQDNKPNLPPLRSPTSTIPSFTKPTCKVASLEEIRKNLSEFRRRSSAPPPTEHNSAPPPPPASSSQPAQPISFQELYKRNVLAKQEGGTGSTESTPSSGSQPMSGKLSFDAIRESLRQMQANQSANTDGSGGGAANAAPFLAFKNSLKLRPMNQNEPVKSTVIGGTQGLPMAVFGKEMEGEGGMKGEISTEFVKMYSPGELGEKLRMLRPEVKKGEKVSFSLGELNERLRKLREMEEKETESRIGGVSFKDLRESLVKLRMSDDEKAKKNSGEYIKNVNSENVVKSLLNFE